MAANTNGTIIQIRRSQTTPEPPKYYLANGELAYSFSSDKLFIGQTNTATSAVTVEYIGGKLLVDKVANLESIIIGAGTRTLGNTVIDGTLTLSNAPNNSVLHTSSNGVVDFATGSFGEVLQIAANGSPVFGDLNGGTF
jgi:hypothetical protein